MSLYINKHSLDKRPKAALFIVPTLKVLWSFSKRYKSQEAKPIWKQQLVLQPTEHLGSLRTRAIKQPSASVNPTTYSGWRYSLSATLLSELKETFDSLITCRLVRLVKY